MIRNNIVILILTTLVGCNNPVVLSDGDKTRITNEVRQALKDYNAEMKKDILAADMKFLDNSDQFFWVPPGFASALSHDSVIAIVKQNALFYRSIDESFDTITIYPLTDNLASYTGQIHSIMTDTAGRVADYRLWETSLMIKRSDGWKLLNGQTVMLNKQ